jgi:hypothetical protein
VAGGVADAIADDIIAAADADSLVLIAAPKAALAAADGLLPGMADVLAARATLYNPHYQAR